MLILTRKVGESIIIGDDIEIVVAEINKNSARIGINAPRQMPIYRKEIYEKILRENRKAVRKADDSQSLDQLNEMLSIKLGG
ncbi:MAG: carbon storage regulator CsrA [Candidatus Cloacimonetes bacterium]|nr:carbon storage regulator CsrA [Candidatus Cloacimonadota bacterium]